MSFNADFIQIDKTTLTVPNYMKSPHLLQKIENIVNILVFQDCFSLIISKLLTVGPHAILFLHRWFRNSGGTRKFLRVGINGATCISKEQKSKKLHWIEM